MSETINKTAILSSDEIDELLTAISSGPICEEYRRIDKIDARHYLEVSSRYLEDYYHFIAESITNMMIKELGSDLLSNNSDDNKGKYKSLKGKITNTLERLVRTTSDITEHNISINKVLKED